MCARYDNFGSRDDVLADETDSYFQKMNARLRPDQLAAGEVAMSINGRMDVDGAWQVRKGVEALGSEITNGAGALILPFTLRAAAQIAISAASRVTTTVTITAGPHGYSTGDQVYVDADPSFSGAINFEGQWTITVTGASEFTYQIPGATGSEIYALSGPEYAQANTLMVANAVLASCRYSDPNDVGSEYILQARINKAYATNLSTGVVTEIAYGNAGALLSSTATGWDLLQVFGKVILFQGGLVALEWNGVLTGTPAFAGVASTAYTQPTVFTTASNAACTAGVVTITEAAHGLAVGDVVKIMDPGTTPLILGDFYQVATVPGAGSFTFYASIDAFTATSVVLGQAQSQGLGFIHMPRPAWGVYHQRRLIVPYRYTVAGTDRDVHDELLFSDILDSNTYDVLQNNFRITAGIADYTKTVHPFSEDNAIAFNRNSLHLIGGLSGSLNDITIKEITKEIGLVARKSCVTIGNSVFFLSDNGVYSVDFGDLYNLRGAGLPLSDPIQPLIKRINPDYAQNAVAVFHNNRYWIAVPLDDSVNNNAILVYNVLNKGWESLDMVESDQWDVSNLLVGSPDGINQLYAVNSFGGIHIIDEREDDVDRVYEFVDVGSSSIPIEGSCTTRQYSFGSPERKKFNSFELHVESSESNASSGQINGIFENMDEDVSITTIDALLGAPLDVAEDSSLRGRIGGIRSYGMQVGFVPTSGRPKLRLVKITAAPTFRATTQAT